MIMEAVVGLILIAISFLIMGFYSNKEYFRVFYFAIGLIMLTLSSGIIYNTSNLGNAEILRPLIYIGVFGTQFIVFILFVKTIIDTILAIPYIKNKRKNKVITT